MWRDRVLRGPLIATMLALAGCSAGAESEAPFDDVEGIDDVDIHEQPLARLTQFTLFTQGDKEVNVCFLSGTTTSRNTVRTAIETTWAEVSQLWFTGWGSCPSSPATRTVTIRINDGGSSGLTSGSAAPGVGGRREGGAQIILNVPADRRRLAWTAVHEMGHVIGMQHEHQRDDNDGCGGGWTGSCAQDSHCAGNLRCDLAVKSGDDARPGRCADGDHITDPSIVKLTPYDRDSVMSYCHTEAETMTARLTAWDVFGIQQLYGRRVLEIMPLYTQWSASRTDHATGVWSTPSGVNANGVAGYKVSGFEGWIFGFPPPGSITTLDLYFHSSRNDHMLVGSQASRDEAVAAGYRYSSTLGWAYTNQEPGTAALAQFWHSVRRDHLTAVVPSAQAAAAEEDGYERVRTEAFVFSPNTVPYKVLWQHWHAGRSDHLLAAADSTTAATALSDGYVRLGMASVSMRFQMPGGVSLKQLWSASRGDHFLTRSTASFAGYTDLIRSQGLVFSSPAPGTKAVKLWFHSGRGDNFTASDGTLLPPNGAYSVGADQGYTFPLQGRL